MTFRAVDISLAFGIRVPTFQNPEVEPVARDEGASCSRVGTGKIETTCDVAPRKKPGSVGRSLYEDCLVAGAVIGRSRTNAGRTAAPFDPPAKNFVWLQSGSGSVGESDVVGKSDLAEIVEALNGSRFSFCGGKGRNKQAGEDRDDRNYDEKLDECEGESALGM